MILSLERYLLPRIHRLHRACNIWLIVLAIPPLIVTIWAQIQLQNKLNLVFHYEMLSFIVFQASMCALLLIAFQSILSSKKCSAPGLLLNVLSALALISAVVCYAIWKGLTTDYTERGALYSQLEVDIYTYKNHKQLVDLLQSELSCCGINDYNDWQKKSIPTSCYNSNNVCPNKNCLHPNGCFESIKTFLKYPARIVLTIAVFLTIIQIITAALSFLLYRSLVINKRIQQLKERHARLTIPRITTISPVPPEVVEINETNEQKDDSAKEEEAEKVEAEKEEVGKTEPEKISPPKDIEIQKNGRNWFVFNFYGNSGE